MLLFVCGFPSGGTDLVKTILNAHPDIYLNGEMPFLKNLAQHGYTHTTEFTSAAEIEALKALLIRFDEWHNIENIAHDFGPDIAERGKLSLEEVLRICFSDKKVLVWGNKTPQNTENIKVLNELFPQAYFLIVTRDIRDVCFSWQQKWGKDKLLCASKWADRMYEGYAAAQALGPERCLLIKFEELLFNAETVCGKICQFLDIPLSLRMVEHYKYTNEKIDGKRNYGLPIQQGNTGKWKDKLLPKLVRRIEEIAFETMILLDYKIEFAKSKRVISSFEIWRGRWNDFWALLLVGNRISQQNSLIQRFRSVLFEFKKRGRN